MQLIRKVEIRYFRSLHTADVTDVGDLNIMFGRNDSGKSNVLRALNLFFNYETDLDRDPDFGIDFCDIRKQQAQRGASKQFFSVRLEFNVPSNYQRSLGHTISLKRQWNRDGDVTDVYPRKITKGAKIQLTKFLSSIDFTYVPAIKDSDTFSRLVRRMYDAAAESQRLKTSTDTFIDSIRLATVELSDSLEKTLGSATKLAAPNDMGQLFRSLDFSQGEDEHSLLLQKGDGIKARHIPELLRYINDNESSVRHFIWGFEEPENSLDLGAAVIEAKRFAEFSGRADTQVFVTSHSPAFYLAGADVKRTQVRRYFVSKQKRFNDSVDPKNAISQIDTVESAETAMGDASLHELPYVIRKLSELQKDRDELAQKMGELAEQIEELKRPCIFVEGESEAKCLTPLFRHHTSLANVKKLKGTPSTTAELLKRVFEDGGNLSSEKTVFLFDNDDAGRRAFKNIANNSIFSTPFVLNQCISVCCLPLTPEFSYFLDKYGIPQESCFFTLEFMYDAEVAAKILYDLMNEEQRNQAALRIREEYHRLSQERSHNLRISEPGTADWFWSRGVPNALKADFFVQCRKQSVDSNLSSLVEMLTPLVEK